MNEAEGWGLLSEHEAAIWHYYKDERTLCKGVKGWLGELTLDESEIVCCKKCKEALIRSRRRIVKQAVNPNEIRLLQIWANGLAKEDSTAQVAALTGFHPNTIKYHRTRLYDKLGATTPANAVYIAMKRGLLE